jgi:hypothetical protein
MASFEDSKILLNRSSASATCLVCLCWFISAELDRESWEIWSRQGFASLESPYALASANLPET